MGALRPTDIAELTLDQDRRFKLKATGRGVPAQEVSFVMRVSNLKHFNHVVTFTQCPD